MLSCECATSDFDIELEAAAFDSEFEFGEGVGAGAGLAGTSAELVVSRKGVVAGMRGSFSTAHTDVSTDPPATVANA